MTLTLRETQALDFEALWSGLPAETKLRIGSAVLEAEFLCQIEIDGGFHADGDDRYRASAAKDEILNGLPKVIADAFPDLLPTEYDSVYPAWEVLDGREPPLSISVRGMVGARLLIKADGDWFVPVGDLLVEIGGAVDLNSGPEDKPHDWLFWTVEDIDAERARRHPETMEVRHARAA